MERHYEFDVKKVTEDLITWIRDWFDENGPKSNAILGMSGGKDSTIAAALCSAALGPDRVIGVAMPDAGQGINGAKEICKYLGIHYMCVPIHSITGGFKNIWTELADEDFKWSEQSEQNIPPRVRMTMLYALSQTYNGRVANTCNLSEDYVGYATLFGDSAGSFSPLGKLTVSEIYQIGDYLKIPYEWVHKTPDDGLPHSSSDEVKFGFTYAELDDWIRKGIAPEGVCPGSEETKLERIERMHKQNLFKTQIIQIPAFDPHTEGPIDLFED